MIKRGKKKWEKGRENHDYGDEEYFQSVESPKEHPNHDHQHSVASSWNSDDDEQHIN